MLYYTNCRYISYNDVLDHTFVFTLYVYLFINNLYSVFRFVESTLTLFVHFVLQFFKNQSKYLCSLRQNVIAKSLYSLEK